MKFICDNSAATVVSAGIGQQKADIDGALTIQIELSINLIVDSHIILG